MKAFLFALLASVTAQAAEPGVSWYSVLRDNGAAFGHASHEVVQRADGTEIIDAQENDLGDQGDKEPGAPWFSAPKAINTTWRTVRKEDKTGQTVSITASSRAGPEWRGDWWRNEARIADSAAEITHQTPAETRSVVVALPPGTRFDDGDALLPAWTADPTKRLEFDNFNIEAMAVEHVVLEAVAAPDAQGRIRVLRKRYGGGNLVALAWLLADREGRIVQVTQPMFGASITIKAVDKETALSPHPAYRALASMMTKSPYRIGQAAIHGHIRYRFGFRDGIEFPVPQTGEQSATAEPGFTTLDICGDCGPGLPSDAATLADALKPTAWLQSDAPEIKAIAEPVARLAISDSRKMDILRRKTREILVRLDFAGHYSALETIARKSGDCTEAAVLLAALGRAAGIPTRVANGLVYSREEYHGVSNTFLPHSWTLAWADGKWRSFDAALDTFDSTHIALTVGDGDARSLAAASQLAGLLRWESLTEVRTSPGN